MLNYSFLEILESLSREELKSFRRFILSPYFNRSPKVVRLYDAIVKFHPNFEHRKLTKEHLHNKVAPGLPYNDITMRRLLFDLQNLAEKFMKQVNFESRKFETGIALIEELSKRQSQKMHARAIKAEKEVLASQPYFDSDICLNSFRLETEDFYYSAIFKKMNRRRFVSGEAAKLISGISYLISYFMLEAVKHNDSLLTFSRNYNVKHNVHFIKQFIDLFDFERLHIFMEANKMKGRNIVELYLNTLRAFLFIENEEFYYRFKEALYSNDGSISADDRSQLYSRLANYCILKSSASSHAHKFDNELFEVYRKITDNRLYETSINKYFPSLLFRNILLQAVKVKELAWMEDFIQNNSRFLHPEMMNDILSYSYATLYFHRGVHERSLEFLSRIQNDEFTFKLDARNLYLMNYYELKQFDTAYAVIKAYKKHLLDNKALNDDTRQYINNFIKYTQKLINFHNTKTKSDPESLKIQIGKSMKISNRDWLLGKVEELSKSARRAV